MKKVLLIIITFFMIVGVANNGGHAKASSDSKSKNTNLNHMDVSEFFEGYEGTFIIKDLNKDKTYIYNEEQARALETPESTFKIANALIGLQTEVVSDEYDIKRWDGVVREFDSWNKDHTLGSAMRDSAIWYYQEVARDIGSERMKNWLDRLAYGNEDIDGGIDQFWLNSSLKITALEQLDFIERLYKEELPLNQSTMKTVKRMMINEETSSYILHGKTGTRLTDFGLGWYVGYVETEDDAYVFVTKINGTGSKAKEITKNILFEYGFITE